MPAQMSTGQRFLRGLFIGLISAGLALAFWHLGWLTTWEAKTWDWRAQLFARPAAATDDIVLILLDQNSLDWAKEENGLSWPWPREVYGAIVNYCKRSGAKALAFDVLFTEHSKYGVDDDAAFGDAIADFGSFAVAVFLGTQSGSQTKWPSNIPPPRIKPLPPVGKPIEAHLKAITFGRATLPIDPVARNAEILSNVHLDPDPDGIYRRIRLFNRFDKAILPSLGLGTYLAAHPQTTLKIEKSRLVVGNKGIPIDGEFNTFLRYRGPAGTHKAYSAGAVLQSEIRILLGETPTIKDQRAFRDKYVLFGFSAPGLYDLRSTPVGGVYPGVEIQATILDNFLQGDFMQAFPAPGTYAVVVLLSFISAMLVLHFSKPLLSAPIGLMLISVPILLAFGAYMKGFWLPLAVQESGVAGSILIAIVFNYATEGRQKRFIKGAFKQYLSPAVIDQLIQHPERLKLGGERRTLSIFFSDLQGFTTISEGLTPEALTQLLNEYLTEMTDIVQDEGGTVDKYEGDAIIAFWNAPIEVPGHALRAVRAALRCQAKLAEMRPQVKARIGKEMYMRIGINTGPAVVGNLGSHNRFDYTMLGDSVNLAARLEGANKAFGTYNMISDTTREMIGDTFAVRELARLAVVGRKAPVTVYEPMFNEEYHRRHTLLDTFTEGLSQFYDGEFEQAIQIFKTISDMDTAAAAYLAKCHLLVQERPENWQGVWVMTSK